MFSQAPTASATFPRQDSIKSISKVVFFDIDNTLFFSNIRESVIFTGGSFLRWRAFFEILKANNFLIGINTFKDRSLYIKNHLIAGNVTNGFPEFPDDEIVSRYDDLCLCLFGYTNINEGLLDLISSELIYFMNQGIDGSKGDALDHAHRLYLKSIPKENIYLVDDDQFRHQDDVERRGFRFILVPPKVLKANTLLEWHEKAEDLEQCCIDFMLEMFEQLAIDFSKLSSAQQQSITHCHFQKSLQVKQDNEQQAIPASKAPSSEICEASSSIDDGSNKANQNSSVISNSEINNFFKIIKPRKIGFFAGTVTAAALLYHLLPNSNKTQTPFQK